MRYIIFICLTILTGCSSLEKDNEPKQPITTPSEHIAGMRGVYQSGVRAGLDEYGLWSAPGGSVGDSALFSCLARVGGATDFNPGILLSEEGQLGRHALLWDNRQEYLKTQCKNGCTPVSKDMMNGFLWCLYDYGLENKEGARDLARRVITFGKAHEFSVGPTGWLMCTEDDKRDMQIDDDDWKGKCLMTPAVVKDIYRVYKWLGGDCDIDCQSYMAIGANIPVPTTGYQRHLSAITTIRNGLVDGAINDNSLALLKKYASDEPRNGIYQAGMALYTNGNFNVAYDTLCDEGLWPKESLPTSANFCTDYVWQRDEVREEKFQADNQGCIKYYDPKNKAQVNECGLSSGENVIRKTYNDDWLPCEERPGDTRGRGVDWLFAEFLTRSSKL